MERAVPILPTSDLAAAKQFYVDGLGFSIAFENSEDGHSGLIGMHLGSIELTLDCPMAGHGRNACVAIHIDDTDRYYRDWSSKVKALRPPKTSPGERARSICSILPATLSSSWDQPNPNNARNNAPTSPQRQNRKYPCLP